MTDPVVASDVVSDLAEHGDAEVTVNIAGTLVDVCRVAYDRDRERFVLDLHPDDLDEVLRKLFRVRAPADPADDRSAVREGKTIGKSIG